MSIISILSRTKNQKSQAEEDLEFAIAEEKRREVRTAEALQQFNQENPQ